MVLAGGAGRVLQMTSATQAQLWEGVQGGDTRAVAAVAAQLGLPPADGAARLPVRVVVLSPGAAAAASAFFVPTGNTSALLRPAALHPHFCRIVLLTARFDAESHQSVCWSAQAYIVQSDLLRQTVRSVAASTRVRYCCGGTVQMAACRQRHCQWRWQRAEKRPRCRHSWMICWTARPLRAATGKIHTIYRLCGGGPRWRVFRRHASYRWRGCGLRCARQTSFCTSLLHFDSAASVC